MITLPISDAKWSAQIEHYPDACLLRVRCGLDTVLFTSLSDQEAARGRQSDDGLGAVALSRLHAAGLLES